MRATGRFSSTVDLRAAEKMAPESGGTRDSPEPGLDVVGSRLTRRLCTCDNGAQMYRQRSANPRLPFKWAAVRIRSRALWLLA